MKSNWSAQFSTITRNQSCQNWIFGWYLLHEFSSDSSLQSGFPLQKSSFSIHSPLPHDNFPSGQIGSSVFNMGNTFLGSKICVKSGQHNGAEKGREKRKSEISNRKHYKITIHHATVSVLMGKKSVVWLFVCWWLCVRILSQGSLSTLATGFMCCWGKLSC